MDNRLIDKNPLAISIPQAAAKIGISPTKFRELVYKGAVPAVKVGTRWIIPVKALENWLDQQLKEQA